MVSKTDIHLDTSTLMASLGTSLTSSTNVLCDSFHCWIVSSVDSFPSCENITIDLSGGFCFVASFSTSSYSNFKLCVMIRSRSSPSEERR